MERIRLQNPSDMEPQLQNRLLQRMEVRAERLRKKAARTNRAQMFIVRSFNRLQQRLERRQNRLENRASMAEQQKRAIEEAKEEKQQLKRRRILGFLGTRG